MPNLVGILPVVWAPIPNKQTNKQTDRHLSFIYIDILCSNYIASKNQGEHYFFSPLSRVGKKFV